MKQYIRYVSHIGYTKVVKPLLFTVPPDDVHKALITTAQHVQKIPVVRSTPRLWAYQSPILETDVAGVHYTNPIGLSAGFDKAILLPRIMRSVGFGWMTGGSVTLGEYAGNEGAWFYRLPKSKSIVVHAGLPSEGTPVVARRVQQYDQAIFRDFPLNVSIAKTNSRASATDEQAIRDYCESLAMFDALTQVRMLEINISCPNTFGGEPFTTAKRLDALLRAVDEQRLTKPVYVKTPVDLPLDDFDALLEVIASHRVAGVAIGNLLKNRSKAVLQDVLPDSIKGSLSGQPTRDLATALIARTYKKYGRTLAIIGIGGVMSPDDAYTKLRAGAQLIALITGMIYEGPQLIGDINAGLVQRLKRDGYEHVSDAVGADVELS